MGNHMLTFTYGVNGPLSVTWNGTTYYYVTNLQGDVVSIVDSAGSVVVNYWYDAYGRPLGLSGSMHSSLGKYNPLRYRGYVYDIFSGFYYLQSRYYNPEIGRFINADGQISGVGGNLLGYNQFAYCFNNPVNMSDPAGNWPQFIRTFVKVIVVVAVQLAYACYNNVTSSNKGADFKAVDKLLENRVIEDGNVQLPKDTNKVLYNKENRKYASKIIKEDLGASTKRTEEDISSEIFAHQFAADVLQPLSILSGKVPVKWDLYQRVSNADIDENESLISIFNLVEEVFEWE